MQFTGILKMMLKKVLQIVLIALPLTFSEFWLLDLGVRLPTVEVVAQTKEQERIIFIPHQELFLVPFAALQDKNKAYLIEKHTILTAPSIQSLSLTRQHRERVKNLPGEALVVGNPTMPQLKKLSPLPQNDILHSIIYLNVFM